MSRSEFMYFRPRLPTLLPLRPVAMLPLASNRFRLTDDTEAVKELFEKKKKRCHGIALTYFEGCYGDINLKATN